jgi:hypothetical protein
VIVDARYLCSFEVKGGVGGWSDAIYDLAEYAEQRPNRTFVLMDWGFSNQLLLLSEARVKKVEAFGQFMALPESEKRRRMQEILASGGSTLVFHTATFESYHLVEWFKRAREQQGWSVHLVKTFHQRDGQPIYLLFDPDIPRSKPQISDTRDGR